MAESKEVSEERESPIWGKNKGINRTTGKPNAAWAKGQVYSSPLWIGYRTGSNVVRLGYSHGAFQDFQQNGVHKHIPFSRQNYYLNYDYFVTGAYSYMGYYNPFSLYNR